MEKFSLIDLEIQKWTTGRKAKSHRERLSEKTRKGCDSLASTHNLNKKVEREIRRGFSGKLCKNFLVTKDQLMSKINRLAFTNLFNEQPAACAVLTGYISP